jgi:Na+:H+ antiporter
VPIATGEAELTAYAIVITALNALAFFGLVTVLSMWILPSGKAAGLFGKIPIIGSHGIQQIFAFANGQKSMLVVLILAVSIGLLAHMMGFHPAVGAYMAGLIVREEYFQQGKDTGEGRRNYLRVRTLVDDVAFTWLGPIFFIVLGGKIIFDVPTYIGLIPEIATLVTLLFVGQVASAGLAARYTGGFTWAESGMIGFGMLGRAELAFVVIDIAYVQNNVFTTEVFYVLMAVTFWLNLAVPLAIRMWLPYYEGKKGPNWLTKKRG